jgi:peptidoglycan/xylan/chitin deacetylase (PgdA/CDA1 family)
MFSAVDEGDLGRYCRTGRWHKRKPGLIVALYNGYRNNYDVFLPLLERYGLTGWFFVATAFAGMPAAEQLSCMARHTLKTVANEYSDGRYALNWSELKQVDRRHVVASHTRHHARLSSSDAGSMKDEIVGPQDDFEKHLGHRVSSFAALSGAAYGENEAADGWIRSAGYQFVFSNFKIQSLWRGQ